MLFWGILGEQVLSGLIYANSELRDIASRVSDGCQQEVSKCAQLCFMALLDPGGGDTRLLPGSVEGLGYVRRTRIGGQRVPGPDVGGWQDGAMEEKAERQIGTSEWLKNPKTLYGSSKERIHLSYGRRNNSMDDSQALNWVGACNLQSQHIERKV